MGAGARPRCSTAPRCAAQHDEEVLVAQEQVRNDRGKEGPDNLLAGRHIVLPKVTVQGFAGRYCSASARWDLAIDPAPSRSARVRATFSKRCAARKDRLNRSQAFSSQA